MLACHFSSLVVTALLQEESKLLPKDYWTEIGYVQDSLVHEGRIAQTSAGRCWPAQEPESLFSKKDFAVVAAYY